MFLPWLAWKIFKIFNIFQRYLSSWPGSKRIFLKIEPPPISECQLSRFESYFGTKTFTSNGSKTISLNIEKTPTSFLEHRTFMFIIWETNLEWTSNEYRKISKMTCQGTIKILEFSVLVWILAQSNHQQSKSFLLCG